MKKITERILKMERKAFCLLKYGLFSVAVISAVVFFHALKAASVMEYMILKEAIPALVMSFIIVVGGAFAFDILLKESEE